MFKKIDIVGFRGFGKKGSIKFAIPNGKKGSGMTTIVGPNNSGKTTIIEAISYYNCDPTRLSFSEGKRNARRKQGVQISYTDERGLVENLVSSASGGSQVVASWSGVGDIDAVPFVLPSRRFVEYNMYNPGHISRRGDYSRNLSNGTMNRGASLNQFESRVFRWQLEKNKFDELLKRVITEPFEWYIEQNNDGAYYIKMLFDNGTVAHAREGVGDGYWSIFTIVDALYDSKPGGVIVIDEPELSLHPAFQKRLLELFEEFSSDRQIIISTHSVYFVSLDSIINGGALVRTYKDIRGNINIGMMNNEDRQFIGSIMNDYNNPHVLGIEARELFFIEDNVIVTEGQEDVVTISKICNDLGIALGPTFFGWGAGGASKIAGVLSLMERLGYKKVTAIYDGDKVSEYETSVTRFPKYNILILPKDDIRDKMDNERGKVKKEGMADSHYTLKSDNEKPFRNLMEAINNYHEQWKGVAD